MTMSCVLSDIQARAGPVHSSACASQHGRGLGWSVDDAHVRKAIAACMRGCIRVLCDPRCTRFFALCSPTIPFVCRHFVRFQGSLRRPRTPRPLSVSVCIWCWYWYWCIDANGTSRAMRRRVQGISSTSWPLRGCSGRRAAGRGIGTLTLKRTRGVGLALGRWVDWVL